MNMLLAGFFAALILVGGAALANPPCQRCTHEMQLQYRDCLQKGRAPEACAKEEQEAAQKCVAICNTDKPPPVPPQP